MPNWGNIMRVPCRHAYWVISFAAAFWCSFRPSPLPLFRCFQDWAPPFTTFAVFGPDTLLISPTLTSFLLVLSSYVPACQQPDVHPQCTYVLHSLLLSSLHHQPNLFYTCCISMGKHTWVLFYLASSTAEYLARFLSDLSARFISCSSSVIVSPCFVLLPPGCCNRFPHSD